MRIAIITKGGLPMPNVRGGGVETLTTALLNENENTENEIVVYCIKNDEAKKKGEEYLKTEFVQLPLQNRTVYDRARCRITKDFPRETPYSFSKVMKLIKRENFDKIVIENTPWQFPYFVKEFGEKVFLHLHNDWVNDSWNENYQKKFRDAINHCGGVLAISNYMKSRVETIQGVDSNKIQVLCNATDLELFSKQIADEERESIRSELGIKKEESLIIYTGRLCEDKGVVQLLCAFENICKRYDTVKLLIVGSVSYGKTTSDSYTDRIRDFIAKYPDKIVTTGFVPYEQIYKYYSIADIHVIPSMWEEPFGLVAIEGMAVGLPIISTDSGGLVEIFDDDCAIIVKRSNIVCELENAIEGLLTDKEKCRKLGAKAKDKIKRHKEYSYAEYYNRFIEMIS